MLPGVHLPRCRGACWVKFPRGVKPLLPLRIFAEATCMVIIHHLCKRRCINLTVGDLIARAMLRVTNAALRACSQRVATPPGIKHASSCADVQCLFNHIRSMQVVCVRNAAVLSRIQKVHLVT